MSVNSEAVAAIKARLIAAAASAPWPVGVFDGPPDATAGTKPYICIYDQTGVTDRGTKAHGGVVRARFPFQLSCVARDRDALRDLIEVARTIVGWSPIAGASPIVEVGSNPIMPETVDSDSRYVAPLTMRSWLPA